MSSLKSFFIFASILGVVIIGLEVYFTVKGWTTGEALNVTSYLSPLPPTLQEDVLMSIEERKENLARPEL